MKGVHQVYTFLPRLSVLLCNVSYAQIMERSSEISLVWESQKSTRIIVELLVHIAKL